MIAAIVSVFHTVIYAPIYNALVFFIDVVPNHDVGVAIVAITIVVRLILFPLSRRTVKAQLAMKKIAPEIDKIKEKYKKNTEEQSKAIFALYKERGIHPFAGFGLILIQFPILIGLYLAARSGLPHIDASTLYSFVQLPQSVNMEFLGVINMAGRSITLAVLAAGSQFAYTRLSMGPSEKSSPVEASLSGDMAKSFEVQARYILPGIVAVIGLTLSAVVPLYWMTGNLFMIAQEYLSGRRFRGT